MPDGYCEEQDVLDVLQEESLGGALGSQFVEPTIEAVSDWLRRQSRRHWYDSTGASSDLVATTAESVSTVRRDVPSSPHTQDRQLFNSDGDARYPVTSHGRYAKIPLPHGYVQSITTLKVRQRDGSVEDWVAASDKLEGRGEDYYVQQDGRDSYGRSYLYVQAASIGPRTDFDGLLTLGYDYGLDAATDEWQDVRRGVATLAALELVTDDDVLTAIPDDGQLVGIDTQYDQLEQQAQDYLRPYLSPPR